MCALQMRAYSFAKENMMQFEEHVITVRHSKMDEEGLSLPVVVGSGTGLAYQPVGEGGQVYDLLHVPSGLAVGYGAETEYEAKRWLELVAPLMDWTQDRESASTEGCKHLKQIEAYREQAARDAEKVLLSCLPVATIELVKDKANSEGWTTREVVEEAVDVYINGERIEEEDIASSFLHEVQQELDRACEKHPPLNSLHEAYAVILEELDEFKAEVWKQKQARSDDAIRAELVQIAAMCMRTVQDLL
jgi:hypothetical protein